eukprot:1605980-Prymnesium_polylepis.1
MDGGRHGRSRAGEHLAQHVAHRRRRPEPTQVGDHLLQGAPLQRHRHHARGLLISGCGVVGV